MAFSFTRNRRGSVGIIVEDLRLWLVFTCFLLCPHLVLVTFTLRFERLDLYFQFVEFSSQVFYFSFSLRQLTATSLVFLLSGVQFRLQAQDCLIAFRHLQDESNLQVSSCVYVTLKLWYMNGLYCCWINPRFHGYKYPSLWTKMGRSLSEIVIKASELLESRENTGYSDQWRLVFVLDLSGWREASFLNQSQNKEEKN